MNQRKVEIGARIRDRAIRRCGELLKQIEPATGKNNQHAQVKGVVAQPFHSRETAAKSAGLSGHQAKQAVRVANVPAADFERQVESSKPPTVTKLAEQGLRSAPRPRLGKDRETQGLAFRTQMGIRGPKGCAAA